MSIIVVLQTLKLSMSWFIAVLIMWSGSQHTYHTMPLIIVNWVVISIIRPRPFNHLIHFILWHLHDLRLRWISLSLNINIIILHVIVPLHVIVILHIIKKWNLHILIELVSKYHFLFCFFRCFCDSLLFLCKCEFMRSWKAPIVRIDFYRVLLQTLNIQLMLNL